MAINVVGISAYFHDAACCVLKDGLIVAAAEEERFTRVKHDSSLPTHAVRACLAQAGLTIADVDCVAYYEQPVKKLGRQLWMDYPRLPTDNLARFDPHRPERDIRERLGYEGPVLCFDHHQSHAASAFFCSGFADAAILTVDGVGEWATTTYGHGSDGAIRMLDEVRFPHSLGLLYSTFTGYLGFEVNEGEYKVMGLAPYGAPKYVREVRQLVDTGEDGQFRLDLRYFDFLGQQRMYSDALVELFGRPARQPSEAVGSFHEDVARSLQVVLEEMLLEKARYLHRRTGSTNLCMAGGVALNCVANSRLLRDGPFERLFVQPAAGDSGGAVGAAMLGYAQCTGAPPPRAALESVLLGPEYGPRDIQRLIAATGLDVLDFRGREAELLDATAARLADGKVLGWFHGRMEFGPRSLGARSILADPRVPDMRDRVNLLVKQREAFRRFAPAVLAERARDHFDLDHPSPFMLETAPVRSPLALPSITHVDGSARVQTVHADRSPRFARLLAAFERATGCPVLLNTSFNVRGEPIVCTPMDALACFVTSGLDALVLEDVIVDRAAVPSDWPDLFSGFAQARRSAVSHTVYTLA
jgi:carbamoyltransferase